MHLAQWRGSFRLHLGGDPFLSCLCCSRQHQSWQVLHSLSRLNKGKTEEYPNHSHSAQWTVWSPPAPQAKQPSPRLILHYSSVPLLHRYFSSLQLLHSPLPSQWTLTPYDSVPNDWLYLNSARSIYHWK